MRSILLDELQSIVQRHLQEIGHYVSTAPGEASLGDVLAHLERLWEMCQHSPQIAGYDAYTEACYHRDRVQTFFQRMNQPFDAEFYETYTGQIWLQASSWCKTAGRQFQLTMQQVWDYIAPVKPDHLKDFGGGQYEARWWKPVPMMDIEILRHTEGVEFCGEPYEPHNLAGGLAVRFLLALAPETR